MGFTPGLLVPGTGSSRCVYRVSVDEAMECEESEPLLDSGRAGLRYPPLPRSGVIWASMVSWRVKTFVFPGGCGFERKKLIVLMERKVYLFLKLADKRVFTVITVIGEGTEKRVSQLLQLLL